ncbi:DUF6518 family protein [Curtobacterium luteum]|uniref:DUF6518 family protein n=1 Tax=Curtobacterium luteum TaxID=33881 RepID=UPI0037FFDA13
METIVHTAQPGTAGRETDPHAVPPAIRVTMATGLALLAGVLCSFGQAVPGLGQLANSAGPWFVVAALLVLLAGLHRRPVLPMVLGVVFLELMHVGYWAATNLRGYPDSLSVTNFWVLIGVPAGLLAGAVVWAVRSSSAWWRAAAAGVTGAVLVGEGVRALLQVAATTGTAFWTIEIVVGAAVIVAGVCTARTPTSRVVALGTGVLGALGVLAVYLLLG